MDTDFLTLPVDETLTFHSAKKRGYTWCIDVGEDTPSELVRDVIQMVKERGYKLGKPSFSLSHDGAIPERGLYKPVGTPTLRSTP
jgi:hypothetical protein